MLKHREVLARLFVVLIVIVLPITVVAYQYWLRPSHHAEAKILEIRAASPERGGFSPAAIEVAAGQTITLRFTSEDVVHGIAIGPGLGIDLGHVDPGKSKEITLTFPEAGAYTFYCNTWCGLDHWRMRGVIDVRDPRRQMPASQVDPVILALAEEGVDIDANLHNKESNPFTLSTSPAPSRGQVLIDTLNIPAELWDASWRMRHTPIEAMNLLAELNPTTEQTTLADVVAYVWALSIDAPSLKQAANLYNQNCAACHGQNGDGQGFAAATTTEAPAAFADAEYMFTRRSDILYAKIRRGGMGTDMPNFGTVFTPDETWALVNYLWTFIHHDEAEANGLDSEP